MPSLLDLADEILLEILVYLELDNPTLSNICRASSRLNGLARPILYRSILFDLPPHDPILQLTRTIDGDDELASQVHGLCLTWPKDCNIPADDRVNIQNLIHKLTSLRHLVVSASLDQRSALPFLEFAEYTELRRVAFMYADLTNSMIMKFMFLPKIEKMVILFLKSLSNPSIPLACQPGTSPLKILHLDHCTPREVVLGTFLQCPKALESLTFAVPPFAEQFHTAVSTRDFSPRQVGSALMHVKHSLVNLTIYWKLSHRHDGSRLDLSSFEKLRFISLPSPLFFNIAYPHASRNGVYRVLPRSLETLEIVFPEPHWIFKFPMCEENGPIVIDNWIMELALNKSACYPSFSRLTLKESAMPKDKGSVLPGSKMAVVSDWVQKAYDEIGIRLRVWTRGLNVRGINKSEGRSHIPDPASLWLLDL